jgi:hypothetical protein
MDVAVPVCISRRWPPVGGRGPIVALAQARSAVASEGALKPPCGDFSLHANDVLYFPSNLAGGPDL